MARRPLVFYGAVALVLVEHVLGIGDQFVTGDLPFDLNDEPNYVDSRMNDAVLALVAESSSSNLRSNHEIDESLEHEFVLPAIKAQASMSAQTPSQTDSVSSPELMHDIESAKKPAESVASALSTIDAPQQLRQMQVDVNVKEGCGLLSPDEAALAHTGIATQDIVLFALVGVYVVVAVAFSVLLRSSTSSAKLRDPALLTLQILAGLVVMVAVSLPLTADYATMFRIMTTVEMFGVPALVLLQALRIYNYQSQLQLYAQRLRSAKVLQATAVTRKGSEVDLEADKSAKELTKRLNATKGIRLAQIGLPILLLLAAATVATSVALAPCSDTALGLAGVVIVLSPSILIAICDLILCFAIKKGGDGFGIKNELFALAAVCMAGAAAQLVVVFALPSAHKTAALVGTYRLGVAAIALALLLVQLVYAAVRMGEEGDPATKQSFDSLFDAMNAQLKARFKLFLDTELCGHLMLFWEDVAAYNLTFSTPDPEVPNEPAAATLRRETVRKAKMGMAARSIFSRYIQPGAPLEIRVDKLMRTELTNRINCNNVTPTMYDSVQSSVHEKMRGRYPRFFLVTKTTSDYTSL